MTGARLVHDTLEQEGWDVEIADAQKVKGLAPLACKTDKIDSITAKTGSRWTSAIRLARVLIESGGTPSWSRCSPSSESRQTSSFLRLRSNPACNM